MLGWLRAEAVRASRSKRLLEANGGINDSGQIVGLAVEISTGDAHGFLAIPVLRTPAIQKTLPDIWVAFLSHQTRLLG